MQENGVLVINKSSGITSNMCIQRIKHTLGQKKIGHAGTLDPMVDGVLLVLLGNATKIASYLIECGKKIYKGRLCIGFETVTWDKEGEVVQRYSIEGITVEKVKEAVLSWLSIEEQEIPPISAAKLNGKALYKWVRMGYDVPSRMKKVHIESVEILSIEIPYVTFRVICSSGTYIRSLAHSLGKRLECGAVLDMLTREYSYPFSLEESVSLDVLFKNKEEFSSYVKPITEALPHFQNIIVTDEQARRIRFGQTLQIETIAMQTSNNAIALYNGKAIALLRYDVTKREWRIARGLL